MIMSNSSPVIIDNRRKGIIGETIIKQIYKERGSRIIPTNHGSDFIAINKIIGTKKLYREYVEVKTGYSKLSSNQILTSKKKSLPLFRFRVPYSLGPAKEVDIYKDEVDSKFLRDHDLVPQGDKTLVLGYELAWRTEEDKRFMKSAKWKKIRNRILDRDIFTCQYCGETSQNTKLTIDHIMPYNKGGKTIEDNLITACEECNIGKWNTTIDKNTIPRFTKDNENND